MTGISNIENVLLRESVKSASHSFLLLPDSSTLPVAGQA
jgi:hypothetical protein